MGMLSAARKALIVETRRGLEDRQTVSGTKRDPIQERARNSYHRRINEVVVRDHKYDETLPSITRARAPKEKRHMRNK